MDGVVKHSIAACLAFSCAWSAAAQVFSAGVKAGTPLSASSFTSVIASRSGIGPYILNVRRYTIGPTFEVALPLFQLRVEVDAVYRRLDTTQNAFYSPTFGTIFRTSANAWEFPMLLKRLWLRGPVRPFAAAGGTFRRINSMQASTEQFLAGQTPDHTLVRYHLDDALTEGGIAAGAGVRLAAGRLKISPEIRYTHWTTLRLQPRENQAEFFLSFTL
jgi:hypothetical protein